MTLATLFIAQTLGVDLTFSQQLTILVVAMLTSKGASGVTGAGFITLAATLTSSIRSWCRAWRSFSRSTNS